MEYLDIVDEMGNPIGKTVSRKDAHEFGTLHRTAHVWVIRKDQGALSIKKVLESTSKIEIINKDKGYVRYIFSGPYTSRG